MTKTILITGATDGIGKQTALELAAKGHTVLLHGRNASKLASVAAEIGERSACYVADLSRAADVETLAAQVRTEHRRVDVLINNAGVYKTPDARTPEGLDVRFVVNVFAPYVLTRRLLEVIPDTGRIVNLSSAAQAWVDLDALAGRIPVDSMDAYAQSKLALTIWSQALAKELASGPVVVAVNPGSLLATKMVREGFGVAGSDVRIGAEILIRAALDPSFAESSGRYYDNDAKRFGAPHPSARDAAYARSVVDGIEAAVAAWGVK